MSLHRIHQLQTWRGRKAADASIGGFVSSIAVDAQRTQRRLGELAELWQELLPPSVVENTALAGLRGGVLHVTAESAAASFELDRHLRGGVEDEIRRRFRGTLVRVRVRIGPLEAQAGIDRPAPATKRAASKRTGRGKK